jgi:hypothetical protein
MFLSFAQWIQATGFFAALRGSAYVYPIVMALHMLGIAFFGGMVLMTDMRLLGFGMRKRSISDVLDQFRVAKRWGLLLIVTCGILMAGSKAEEYYYNAFFRAKLILLAVVVLQELVFYRNVYANPAALDQTPRIPGTAKSAAALSILLWTAIACCGRGIGYIEPPLEKIHAQVHFLKETTLAALRGPGVQKGQDH